MKIELSKRANELNLEDAIVLLRSACENNKSVPRSFSTHCKKLIEKFCDPLLSPNEQLYILLNPGAIRLTESQVMKSLHFWKCTTVGNLYLEKKLTN